MTLYWWSDQSRKRPHICGNYSFKDHCDNFVKLSDIWHLIICPCCPKVMIGNFKLLSMFSLCQVFYTAQVCTTRASAPCPPTIRPKELRSPPLTLITTLNMLYVLNYTPEIAAYEPTCILGPHRMDCWVCLFVWFVGFYFRFIWSFKAHVCLCVSVWYVHVNVDVSGCQKRVSNTPGAWLTESCERPSMGAGKWTWVICDNSMQS